MQQDVAPSLVLQRLKTAYGADTLEQLAAKLGRPVGTVKGWSARHSVPIDVLMRASAEKRCSVDWLLGSVNDPMVRGDGSIYEPTAEGLTDAHRRARASKELKQSATVAGLPGHSEEPTFRAHASKELKQSATVAGLKSVADDEFQPLSFTVQTDAAPYKVTDQHKRNIRAREPEDVPAYYSKALIAGGAPGPGVLPLAGDGSPLVGGFVMAPPPTPSGAPLVIPVRYPDNQQRDFEVLPTFRGAASAGVGLQNAPDAELDQAGYIAIDRRWMRANWGRAGNGFASVLVAGDSMEPTLSNGETIVVDTTVDRADASAIYVIRSGLDFLVKRVHRQLDGTLIIKGDNPAYEAEVVAPKQSHTIEILGRMVWPRVRR